jgi:hypothetical protein
VALAKTEFWRAPFNSSNCNDATKTGCVWTLLSSETEIIDGTEAAGQFFDNPANGTWWYGMHVIDRSGNIGVEPNIIKALKSGTLVTASCTRTVTKDGTGNFNSIQSAANASQVGWVICVKPGTYNERITITTSGSSDKKLIFRTEGQVITKGFTIRADHVTIKGFEVDGGWQDCESDNGWGIFYEGSSGVIEDNLIRHNCEGGIVLYAPPYDRNNPITNNIIVKNNKAERNRTVGIEVMGRNHRIENNEVIGTVQILPDGTGYSSGADADGFRFFGSGHVFKGNRVHGIDSHDPLNIDPHVDCFQSWGPADNIKIENSLCEMPGPGTKVGSVGKGFQIVSRNNNISHITLWNNVVTGMRALHCEGSSDVIFVNNVHISDIHYNTLWGPPASVYNCPSIVVKNNIFYDPHVIPIFSFDTPLNASNNNIYRTDGILPDGIHYPDDLWGVDPKFVDVAAKDFHLSADSPLIDAGVSHNAPSNDFEGTLRPQGGGFDIGVDEVPG